MQPKKTNTDGEEGVEKKEKWSCTSRQMQEGKYLTRPMCDEREESLGRGRPTGGTVRVIYELKREGGR